jgi:hypothetical protein
MSRSVNRIAKVAQQLTPAATAAAFDFAAIAAPVPTDRMNAFLLKNGLLMTSNPCVSPDFCLNWPALSAKLASGLDCLTIYPKSTFPVADGAFTLAEDTETGDHCWLFAASGAAAAKTAHNTLEHGTAASGAYTTVYPATFNNLIKLKNAAQEADSACAIFPAAAGTLDHQSLGIGARMTAMHWPAVDWTMATLGLSVTANQNSIPRELVFDVNEMLDGTLDVVGFPFIGCNIPEGHQGQSVEGMTHGSIIAKVKHGFHLHKLPWGFNADHQPIGGKFDAREDQLVRGSLFATYITYDISHELQITPAVPDPKAWVAANVPQAVWGPVQKRLADAAGTLNFAIDEVEFFRLIAYVWPSMVKMKQRDEKYAGARNAAFSTALGRAYFREMSIDELPGLTTPATLATILALCEQMGMETKYVAPAFGWQKNIPFADNAELERRVSAAWAVCKEFKTSIGFHSGSGKSAENYELCGRITGSNMEVKTSGRYSYELGRALHASSDPSDQAFWQQWYSFTQQLSLNSAFSTDNETEAKMAREFITATLEYEGASTAGVFDSRDNCIRAMTALEPNPEHILWFEYNFLFVLAAGGLAEKVALGDHSPAGYRQRARFYGGISDEGRLNFAKRIAAYIIFLAETCGMSTKENCAQASAKLEKYATYGALLDDIAPQ